IWDLAVTAVAWIGSYQLRFESGWIPVLNTPPEFHLCWRYLPLVLLLAGISYRITGQYSIHRLRRFREDMVCVIRGTVLLSLLVMAPTFSLHDHYDPRVTMLLFSVLTPGGLLPAGRLSWVAIRRLRSRGYNQTRALIVGTGRVARKTADALEHVSW